MSLQLTRQLKQTLARAMWQVQALRLRTRLKNRLPDQTAVLEVGYGGVQEEEGVGELLEEIMTDGVVKKQDHTLFILSQSGCCWSPCNGTTAGCRGNKVDRGSVREGGRCRHDLRDP
jgi:hypothetical protein